MTDKLVDTNGNDGSDDPEMIKWEYPEDLLLPGSDDDMKDKDTDMDSEYEADEEVENEPVTFDPTEFSRL